MRVLDVNERTAQRRREQGALTAEESDRVARIARVTQRAVEAFGDSAQATAWLGRANRALSGIAPLELLGSDAGAESHRRAGSDRVRRAVLAIPGYAVRLWRLTRKAHLDRILSGRGGHPVRRPLDVARHGGGLLRRESGARAARSHRPCRY